MRSLSCGDLCWGLLGQSPRHIRMKLGNVPWGRGSPECLQGVELCFQTTWSPLGPVEPPPEARGLGAAPAASTPEAALLLALTLGQLQLAWGQGSCRWAPRKHALNGWIEGQTDSMVGGWVDEFMLGAECWEDMKDVVRRPGPEDPAVQPTPRQTFPSKALKG